MVGEIFIVDNPKDLGALVRDTSRYEGTLSPDDLYELGESNSLFSLKWPRLQDRSADLP